MSTHMTTKQRPGESFTQRLGAALLACLMVFQGAALGSERVVYYHNDALGSPIATTNAQGAVIWREEYQPYGERLLKQDGGTNTPWFTGKPEEERLGLSYFGARWYDPSIGQFLAIDPAGPQEGNPQSFNRYAYANNNPYRYVDPNGNSPLDVGFFIADSIRFTLAVFSGNPEAIASAGVDLAISAIGLANPVPGTGLAMKAARAAEKTAEVARAAERGGEVAKGAEKGGLNLFKWGKETTTKADGWKEGDFMLYLPDKGSAKANWAQNAGQLREQVRQGNPIYDSYRDPVTGLQIPTGGFLGAERNLLESRGWQYNPTTGAYHPPGP